MINGCHSFEDLYKKIVPQNGIKYVGQLTYYDIALRMVKMYNRQDLMPAQLPLQCFQHTFRSIRLRPYKNFKKKSRGLQKRHAHKDWLLIVFFFTVKRLSLCIAVLLMPGNLFRLSTFSSFFFGSIGKSSYLCARTSWLNIHSSLMNTQSMIQQIADYFKTQPVLKAWIFGSYACGEQTALSDIDILIQPEKTVGLFKLSGMHLDLQDMLHIDVDLVTEKGLLPFARKSADLDKILIYERTA